MSLEGTANVPVVGKVKKQYVAVALAGVAGVVAFAWYRRSQATEAAPDFYADTRTGSDLPTDEYKNPGGVDTSTPSDGPKAPTTDVEWANAVVEKLSWYEPGFVSVTVGKYLAGQVLATDEQTMIREAWAQVGKPPGGQRIVTQQPTPTTPTPIPTRPIPGGTTGPRPPTTPAPAPAMSAPPSFRAVRVTRTSVGLAWGPVHAKLLGYRVFENGSLRLKTIPGSPVTMPGLHPGTRYTLSVCAVYPGWIEGPRSSITVTTAK